MLMPLLPQPIPLSAPACPTHARFCAAPCSPSSKAALRPRIIPQREGRALEILGHAIEYLADEYALVCRRPLHSKAAPSGEVQAIEILKAHSRDIYSSCPFAPSLIERICLWLDLLRA